MIPALIPGAIWRPISYRADAGPLVANPQGWVLHVVEGNGSPFYEFENAPEGNRRFSHGWVAKSGLIEQYTELSRMSWAQADGNPAWWSWESEGFPGEPLTDAQVAAFARIHNTLGAADAVVDSVSGRGVGTHVMGGAAWGGHTCPGPGPRAGQRAEIIARARAMRARPTPPPVASRPIPAPAPRPVIVPSIGRELMVTAPHMHGLDVALVQRRVGVVVDDDYGNITAGAVRAFQRRYWPGDPSAWDGRVGPRTTVALGLRWVG